jgi:peptide/nickel transport system ATP-binding protein
MTGADAGARQHGSGQMALLDVRGLTTLVDLPDGPAAAVDRVGFELRAGRTLCLVGESGSGKSMTAASILRLLPPRARVVAGQVFFKGRDLLALSPRDLERVRGAEIGLVFQEPAAALNPVFTIGAQMAETLRVHGRAAGARDARAQGIALLRAVRMPEPERRIDDYLHQLSGGLRQRAMIAVALACSPALLIADEPTTALDVTLQAEILDLLRTLRDESGMAILLITHDPGVVAAIADDVAVMYAGRIVEHAPVRQLLRDPMHPYTRALLASVPGGAPGTRLAAIPGSVPALGASVVGCPFSPRCPDRFEPCDLAVPALAAHEGGRTVRCYLHSPAMERRAEPAGITRVGAAE